MEANESQRRLVLVVGCALVLGLIVSPNFPLLGQTAPERFWLAGRYDGNQIIVYFDAVKFGETISKDAVKIHYPICGLVLQPGWASTRLCCTVPAETRSRALFYR